MGFTVPYFYDTNSVSGVNLLKGDIVFMSKGSTSWSISTQLTVNGVNAANGSIVNSPNDNDYKQSAVVNWYLVPNDMSSVAISTPATSYTRYVIAVLRPTLGYKFTGDASIVGLYPKTRPSQSPVTIDTTPATDSSAIIVTINVGWASGTLTISNVTPMLTYTSLLAAGYMVNKSASSIVANLTSGNTYERYSIIALGLDMVKSSGGQGIVIGHR